MRIKILYTGDTHGCLDGQYQLGGFPCLTTVFKAPDINDSNTLTLRLFGGDLIGSFPLSTLENHEPDIRVMRLWNLDAFAVGNHDFDKGPKGLRHIIDGLNADKSKKTTFLAANMDATKEPLLNGLVQAYLIKEDIAIIGLITLETIKGSHAGQNIVFREPGEVLRELIPTLKSQGIKKIILLSHLGYPEDIKLAEEELKQYQMDFVILGNHTHTVLGDGLNPDQFGVSQGANPIVTTQEKHKTLITAAAHHGFLVGNLQLEYDSHGNLTKFNSNPFIVIDQTRIRADQEAQSIITEFKKKAYAENPDLFKVVARTDVDIIALEAFGFCKELEDINRREESICGNLAADGYQHFVSDKLGVKSDFALFHAGGFRTDIERGPIYAWQLMQAHPYEQQKLVTLSLTGEQLKQIFEESLSGLKQEKDYHRNAGFLHVSAALAYEYTDTNSGKRIKSIKFNGKEVESNQNYRVTVNSFMLCLDKDNPLYPTLQEVARSHKQMNNPELYVEHGVRDLEALRYECEVFYKAKAINENLLGGRIRSNLPSLRTTTGCNKDLDPRRKEKSYNASNETVRADDFTKDKEIPLPSPSCIP